MFEFVKEIKLLRESIESLKESVDRMANYNKERGTKGSGVESGDVFRTQDGLYNYNHRKIKPKE